MADIQARAFKDGDLPGVLDLLRASLGETPLLRRTPELFAWKHFDNPFGRSIVMVAESDDQIVGLRALMRWELDHPSGRLRCVRAVDTATHPDFQRRGIFRMLTTAAVDLARADGIDLIFNTPNPQSGAGYLSMGWHEVDHIGVLARPLRGLLRRNPPPDELPNPSDFVDEPALTAAPSVPTRESAKLRTPRTPEYLAWRLADHPTAQYVRGGDDAHAVIARPNVRNGRRELVISDLFGVDPGKAFARWVRSARADYAAGWFSAGSPERRAVVRGGMVPVPRVRSLRLIARPLRPLPFNVFDVTNWDLAMSDLELL
jgi:GNAT superfamily N-acetyltransferase